MSFWALGYRYLILFLSFSKWPFRKGSYSDNKSVIFQTFTDILTTYLAVSSLWFPVNARLKVDIVIITTKSLIRILLHLATSSSVIDLTSTSCLFLKLLCVEQEFKCIWDVSCYSIFLLNPGNHWLNLYTRHS